MLKPFELWWAAVIVTGLSFFGYFAMRLPFVLRVLMVVLVGGLAASCAGPSDGPPPAVRATGGDRVIAVTADDWHAAIVLPHDAVVATGLLPEADDFPDAAFLEFGWGDRTYYPSRDKTLLMTLGAALTDTPAIMHVAGLAAPPAEDRPSREIVEIGLDEAAFRRLVGAIAATFERPDAGRASPVSEGLYPGSLFYHAEGSFHLFNTCNTWVARMLAAAGVAIRPGGIITTGELMRRLRAAVGSR